MENTETQVIKPTIRYAGKELHYMKTRGEGEGYIDMMQEELNSYITQEIKACYVHNGTLHHLYTELKPLTDETNGALDIAKELAAERNDDSLYNCLHRLMLVDHYQGTKTYLYTDFADYSFYFQRWRDAGKVGDDVTRAGNGGIIFHGPDQKSATMSVTLTPVNGWATHT